MGYRASSRPYHGACHLFVLAGSISHHAVILILVRCFACWDKDPQVIYQARCSLIDLKIIACLALNQYAAV